MIRNEKDTGTRIAMAYLNALRIPGDSDYKVLSVATAILLGKGENLKQYISKTILEFYKDLNKLNSSHIDMFGVNPKSVVNVLLENNLITISKDDKENIRKIEQSISENKASASFFKKDYKYKISDLTDKIVGFIDSKNIDHDEIPASKPNI